MITSGSCVLPLVVAPEDRVLGVLFRVVQGLLYGPILVARFFRGHATALGYAPGRGVRLGIDSRYISLWLYPEHSVHTLSPDWRTQSEHIRFRKARTQEPWSHAQDPESTSLEAFCAVKPSPDAP